MQKINIGIDLGTTYSAVATFSKEKGSVQILKNGLGKETTPSVVWIENGNVVVGEEAKDEQKAGNTNTCAFYKSMMGDVNWSAYIDGEEYSAEQLSGFFLKYLVDDIKRTNNVEVGGAVITVPAYFNDKQREATLRAGQYAGLNVLKIINEPTSAIIAYGLTSGKDKNVLVYDLGGGTFDVTIAHVSGTRISVMATNGNHQLGGKDWDQVLFDIVKDKFEYEFGVDINNNEADVKELQVRCEDAKKRLTSAPSTVVSIQSEGYLGKYTITRAEFDEGTRSLLDQTIMLIGNCFTEISEDTGRSFGWKDIDEVVLVGGSTRMPQVKDFIVKEYGRQPVTKDINVDTIVAAGAAMQAELCTSSKLTLSIAAKPAGGASGGAGSKPVMASLTISNSDIQDITAHGLGMLAFNDKDIVNSIIIKKNSPVNKEFARPYDFSGDKLYVYVLQGESRDPFDNDLLCAYSITGMPTGQTNKFNVNFLYNSNGVVEVNARLNNGVTLKAQRENLTETLAEIIARLKREREEAEEYARLHSRVEVMIVIDSSGSMCGESMDEAIRAAKGFVDESDLSKVYVSVVSFAERTKVICRWDNNKHNIYKAIDQVETVNVGAGTSSRPIADHYRDFAMKGCPHVMIILTDGYWTTQSSEINAANKAKRDGIIIYGIGIGDADQDFLDAISSNGGQKVDLSQLTQTFKDIASSIATESGNKNSLM